MLLRNVTAALLMIFLFIGSLSQGIAGVTINTAVDATNSGTHCHGSILISADDAIAGHAKTPMNCGSPEKTSCLRIAAQCPFMPLYTIAAATSVPLIQPTAYFRAAPTSADYQSPIADVLTPPPDSLS
jgi:hypothetical protein